VNVDVAIVVDRLNGTRETHAWETSMLTLPVFGQDNFSHEVTNATSSYPFTRNGLQGTTRIWVGVDGHVTTVAFAGGGAWKAALGGARDRDPLVGGYELPLFRATGAHTRAQSRSRARVTGKSAKPLAS